MSFYQSIYTTRLIWRFGFEWVSISHRCLRYSNFFISLSFFLNNRQLTSLSFHDVWCLIHELLFLHFLFSSRWLSWVNFSPLILLSLICLIYCSEWIKIFSVRWHYVIGGFFLFFINKSASVFQKLRVVWVLHHFFHGLIIGNWIRTYFKIGFLQLIFQPYTESFLLLQLICEVSSVNQMKTRLSNTLVDIFIIYSFHELSSRVCARKCFDNRWLEIVARQLGRWPHIDTIHIYHFIIFFTILAYTSDTSLFVKFLFNFIRDFFQIVLAQFGFFSYKFKIYE